jgi:hypothetical protein
MNHLKSYHMFESKINDDFLHTYFTEREVRDIETTVSEIESNKKTVAARKGKDLVTDTILDSKLFEFYRKYKTVIGQRVSMIPVPDKIYEYSDILSNINRMMEEDNGSMRLLNPCLKITKEMIVYLSYFQYILHDFDKRVGLSGEIKDLFVDHIEDKKYVCDTLCDNKGAIRNTTFAMDSHMEIFTIEKVFLDKMEYIKNYEKYWLPSYQKFFHKHIESVTFEEQLYNFKHFFSPAEYTMRKILNDESVSVTDYKNDDILGKSNSMFIKKEKNQPIVFEFTGDLIEDYRRYEDAYRKSRNRLS